MLEVGDKAPNFSGKDQSGNKISLSDFAEKKLILYFYPEDDTELCTLEACNLRDNFSLLKKNGFQILGVSKDDEISHQKFIAKYNLPFPLLADIDKKTLLLYGAWGEKNMYGNKVIGTIRKTFVIDEKGIIEKIFLKPRSREHAQQILKAYEKK